MKTFHSIALAFLIAAGFLGWSYVTAQAATVLFVPQGGTGSTTLSGILKGNGTAAVGTVAIGSNLSWDGTTLSATGGGGGGSGTVSTSSAETSTYIPVWTSTGATPATLSGGESTFTYNATDNRLTVTYASTTALTVSGTASTTDLVISGLGTGSNRIVIVNGSGVVSSVALPLTYANGGGGTISNSTGALAYYGATSLQNIATSSATLGVGLTGSIIGVGAGQSLSVATSSLYTGTTGQFPYFSGTNTLTATSSLSINTAGEVITTRGLFAQLTGSGNQFPLEVANAGTSGAAVQRFNTANGIDEPQYAYIRSSSGDLGFYTGQTAPTTLGTQRVTIATGGNVGVGSTTPGTLLSVGTTLGANITGSSATSTFGGPLRSTCFTTDGTTCLSSGGSGTVNSGTTGQFPYYAGNGTAVTATSSIFVDTAQRIGVSSTTPNKTLSVGGEVFASATSTSYGMNVLGGTGTSTGYIYSKTAGFGGRIILEDTDAAGCTEITALNGTVSGAVVTCPTEI